MSDVPPWLSTLPLEVGVEIIQCLGLDHCRQAAMSCSALRTWTAVYLNSVRAVSSRDLRDHQKAACALRFCFRRCRSLKDLDLRDGPASSLAALHQAPSGLLSLNVEGCSMVTSAMLIDVAYRCRHLHTFIVRRCPRVDDSVLYALAASCYALRALSVSECTSVTGAGVAALGRLAVLRDVGLRLCALHGPSMHALAHCRGLRCLDVGHTKGLLPASCMAYALRSFPHLRALSLQGQKLVDDSVLAAVSDTAAGLETLICSRCPQVTSAGIVRVLQRCRGLRHLAICHLAHVQDSWLVAIAEHHGALERLDLMRCDGITSGGLRKMLSMCEDRAPGRAMMDIQVHQPLDAQIAAEARIRLLRTFASTASPTTARGPGATAGDHGRLNGSGRASPTWRRPRRPRMLEDVGSGAFVAAPSIITPRRLGVGVLR